MSTRLLDFDAKARMVREARAMAKLSHPYVVAVHDVDDSGPSMVLIMEYVRAGTLRDWLRNSKRSLDEVVARFLEAGWGVAAAHPAGLMHRDFKPSNVLVTEDGRAKVTDFGLVKLDPNSDSSHGGAPVAPPLNR